jgi:hypothetical protein
MRAVEVFKSACPEGFLRDVAGGLSSAYAAADSQTRGALRRDEEIANTYPWMRRGLVEQMLRDVAAGYPSKIVAKVERGNFWFRAELKFGRINLTQCAAFDPDMALRPAIYRTELAKLNQPKSLFPGLTEFDAMDDGQLCAVLLHGRRASSYAKVRIAVIKFPKPNIADGFYDDKIDLCAEFPEAFLDVDTPIEAIPEPAIPELHGEDQTGSQ